MNYRLCTVNKVRTNLGMFDSNFNYAGKPIVSKNGPWHPGYVLYKQKVKAMLKLHKGKWSAHISMLIFFGMKARWLFCRGK